MSSILIEKNILVPMRDGVRLATDVYRLGVLTPAPVLIARTPYNKENAAGGSAFDIFRAVQAGYAVVIQDVRGRYASEGEFNPHFQETQDGVDAFAWVAAQPWSNGNLGTFGGSYLGSTQWLPAREQPPALRAMAPSITFSDIYEGCLYQGGAKVLHDLRWVVADIFPAEIQLQLAEGDQVMTYKTFHGTHQGHFMGIPPTGKQVVVDVIDILTIKDGKIAEHWTVSDMLGMLQQLGVIPAPGT